MGNELLAAAAALWILAAILALIGRPLGFARILLGLGALCGIVAAVVTLPAGTAPVSLPLRMADEATTFQMTPDALWLMGFGLVPAALGGLIASPSPHGCAAWLFGTACSLLGALGVFGLQHGGFFLVAWELMSLGGALMILSERLAPSPGQPVLFMLGMLEVGAVALLVAFLLLGVPARGLSYDAFVHAGAALSVPVRVVVGLLLVIGFGAKLGLLPFYEWFPGAYGSGSGASGAVLSGVVLNAAYFALSRSLLGWLPGTLPGGGYGLGIFVVAVGVLSAILTVLYAFQQEDWRCLLSFSSAENAAIAVTALGVAILFQESNLPDLAGLAWTVALLHLAGHALAKGGLFLAADGVFAATGSYLIRHSLLARRTHWIFSVGALFAAMSLAAMPPQAGFVSEWFTFQTVFQGFHLPDLAGRLTLALAGAGLALTAAVAFATFIKVFGIGLLGGGDHRSGRVPATTTGAVGLLGASVLALAVGMPWWLSALADATVVQFGTEAAAQMRDGLLLVPLTATFAFISPTLLVVVMPLLALVPILLLLASRRFTVRRVPVWYGGVQQDVARTATTALTFSNALRTFYSFIYRPTIEATRESPVREYFVTRLDFSHDVAPMFGPYLFAPAVRLIQAAADRLRLLQSGHLNFYLGLIGFLLVVILGLVLV
ncbi:proton-conducting transporter transmembrane domain-containing protein [Rhodopila globiformis]|uniref:Hydrogenase 4 subunit B n=1 Tax=Rhodopila globiformis TaxID=1071 RepID=A0A2S6NGT5_RHOGL|nr:proton-conducting transporter membrane subunit [Rhodopila globiformis]PPQ33821.1 hydrogenase 4 subunit B [Rhodopila globiformis]